MDGRGLPENGVPDEKDGELEGQVLDESEIIEISGDLLVTDDEVEVEHPSPETTKKSYCQF